MPIDASIPLSYKPVQTPNMLAAAAQGQELGINALKMNALLQETEGQNAVQKWQQSGGDINSPDAPNQMLKMGVPLKTVQSFVKSGLETKKLSGDIFTTTVKQAKDALPGITDQAGYSAWRNYFKDKMPPGYTLPEQYSPQAVTGLMQDAKSYMDTNVVSANTKATNHTRLDIHNDTMNQQNAVGTLTPESITNAAARYNIDGTLPPLGMGKDNASRIL
jgi:hypothetical protein